MKYCTKCGNPIEDNAAFCNKCGAPVEGNNVPYNFNNQVTEQPRKESGLTVAAKVFLIISCVVEGLIALIPLCWCIPMTVSYINKRKAGQPVSTGFKVCTLLFVNLIAGILMLCEND